MKDTRRLAPDRRHRSRRTAVWATLIVGIFVGLAPVNRAAADAATFVDYESDPQTLVPSPPMANHAAERTESREIGATPAYHESHPMLRVATSLAIVLGLLFVGVWVLRQLGARPTARNRSRDLLELLGRERLAGKSHVCVVRFGERVLLLGDGPTGLRTLAQITEPEECGKIMAYYGSQRPSIAETKDARRVKAPSRGVAAHYTPTEEELRAWIRREQTVPVGS